MNYRIRFHPLVARDLDAIAHWILDYAGPDAAVRKLAEIEATIAKLKATPHKGSLRDEIAPGLRAIPAGCHRIRRRRRCRRSADLRRHLWRCRLGHAQQHAQSLTTHPALSRLSALPEHAAEAAVLPKRSKTGLPNTTMTTA